MNTNEPEFKVRAFMLKNDKKYSLETIIEKRPTIVDDGHFTLRDYIHIKVNDIITAMMSEIEEKE